MPTFVNIPRDFEKQIKHLKREDPSVTSEVREFVLELQNDARPGDEVPTSVMPECINIDCATTPQGVAHKVASG